MSTFNDGSAIRTFQLLAVRAAMRLELKGLQHSRGSVIAKWKKHLGLKGNKQKVYDQFCALHGLDALDVRRCAACGAEYPAGQSCICFDNGAQ